MVDDGQRDADAASRSPSLGPAPRLIRRPLALIQQGPTNDCGPCATSMAALSVGSAGAIRESVTRLMRGLRVPLVGATTPRAVRRALGRLELECRGGWFATIDDLIAAVDADLPTLVIVRPTDFGPQRWFELHYRVVVGYAHDSAAPGGGWLYFACSSAPPRPIAGGDGRAEANVALPFATFERQWRTWATWCWRATVAPRRQPVG